MKKKFIPLLLLPFVIFVSINSVSFAFSNPFKKKYDKEEEAKQPMVHTVDEWLEEATNVKMDMRKREEAAQEDEKNENYIAPSELPSYIEAYNVKAGSKELDLTNLLKNKFVRSPFVANPDFSAALYTEVFYYPQTRQTASTLYLIETDSSLGKKERLSDLSVFEHTRYPLISTALPYLKEGLFSTLTAVDFSSDGKKIIVKEKRGSNKYGLYETYVWIYFLTDENREMNSCYMNNLDFSKEMSSYEIFENASSSSQNVPFYNKINDDGNFDFDFNKLQSAPDKSLSLNSTAQYGNIQDNGQTISGFGHKNGVWNSDGNSGNNNEYGKENGSLYNLNEEDIPRLNYKDLSNFIKTVWKEDAMTSPVKSRWYNKVPVDFRVDDTYNEKQTLGFGVRLNLLNEMIKAYWFDRQNLILNHIRWDLNPLGFNASNNDEIVVVAWAYDKEGNKISLGRWGVSVTDGLVRVIPDEENIQIEANAFYLVKKLNP